MLPGPVFSNNQVPTEELKTNLKFVLWTSDNSLENLAQTRASAFVKLMSTWEMETCLFSKPWLIIIAFLPCQLLLCLCTTPWMSPSHCCQARSWCFIFLKICHIHLVKLMSCNEKYKPNRTVCLFSKPRSIIIAFLLCQLPCVCHQIMCG